MTHITALFKHTDLLNINSMRQETPSRVSAGRWLILHRMVSDCINLSLFWEAVAITTPIRSIRFYNHDIYMLVHTHSACLITHHALASLALRRDMISLCMMQYISYRQEDSLGTHSSSHMIQLSESRGRDDQPFSGADSGNLLKLKTPSFMKLCYIKLFFL